MKIDEFMPRFDVRARYKIEVQAPPQAVYHALLTCDFSDSLLVRALMSLRSGRLRRPAAGKPLRERLRGTGFVELVSVPDRELVIGVAGKFWRPDGGRCLDLTSDTFQHFDRSGYATAVWNFSLEPLRRGATLLATETRVRCLGAPARRRFKAYWAVVGPFSGLIRKAMLRQVKHAAEISGG